MTIKYLTRIMIHQKRQAFHHSSSLQIAFHRQFQAHFGFPMLQWKGIAFLKSCLFEQRRKDTELLQTSPQIWLVTKGILRFFKSQAMVTMHHRFKVSILKAEPKKKSKETSFVALFSQGLKGQIYLETFMKPSLFFWQKNEIYTVRLGEMWILIRKTKKTCRYYSQTENRKKHVKGLKVFLVGGWAAPLKKICSSNWIISPR